jgi:tRNA(His) 5'-end guanylyltransferase
MTPRCHAILQKDLLAFEGDSDRVTSVSSQLFSVVFTRVTSHFFQFTMRRSEASACCASE